MKTKTPQRIDQLDGLRGIAAFIVILCHFAFSFYPVIVYGPSYKSHFDLEWVFYLIPPFNLLFNGKFAVTIFFVLSGYVLSYRYFENRDISKIRDLALRRYIRLVIPVVTSVIIVYLLLKFNLFYAHLIATKTYSLSWMNRFNNINPSILEALNQGLFSSFLNSTKPTYNVALWTMYYEFLGSFLVFAFLALFGNYKRRYIVYLILALLFWQTYFIGFIFGMLIADYNSHIKTLIPKQLSNISWLLILVVALIFGSIPIPTAKSTIYHYFYAPFIDPLNSISFFQSLGAFLLILCVMNTKWFIPLLTNRISLFLGKISFSMYLIHMMIIFSISSYIFSLLVSKFNYHISFAITFFISLAFIFTLSFIYEKLVDKKGVELSRYLVRKIGKD